LAGRWEGSWRSDANGHTGRLRCVVTPLGPNRYRAHFHAVYWKIFRFAYAVELNARAADGGRTAFQGAADLGWWAGGRYSYAGDAGAADFAATYNSRYDHGVFRMQRAHP
jgi:hypothetical protein